MRRGVGLRSSAREVQSRTQLIAACQSHPWTTARLLQHPTVAPGVVECLAGSAFADGVV